KHNIRWRIGKPKPLLRRLDHAWWQSKESQLLMFEQKANASKKTASQTIESSGEKILRSGRQAAVSLEQLLSAARAFLVRGKHEEAIVAFGLALEKDAGSAMAYIGRAVARHNAGSYEKAILDVDAALSLDSLNHQAYCYRAACYARLRQHDSAIRDYGQAIYFSPKNPQLYCSRAFCYEQMGLFE